MKDLRRVLTLALACVVMLTLAFGAFAQEATTTPAVTHEHSVPFFPDTFWPGVAGSLVFGGVGIVLALLSYLLFDLITPKLSLQTQLNNGNVAVGIVVAALILGAFYVAGVAIH